MYGNLGSAHQNRNIANNILKKWCADLNLEIRDINELPGKALKISSTLISKALKRLHNGQVV